MFTARGTYEWISILQDKVNNYTASKHKTTGFKPTDVKQKHV